MKHNSSTVNGFSLLELLIYLAILSAVMSVLAGMFFSINKGQGQAEAMSEVNGNLRFAIEKLSQDLRSASSVSAPAIANATSTTMTAVISGSDVIYCVSDGKLRRQAGGVCDISSEPITDNSVIVNSLIFTRMENTNQILSKTAVTIAIDITIGYDSASPDKQYTGRKKTTISLR